MDLSNLNKEITFLDDEISDDKELANTIRGFQTYNKDDKVVSSDDILKKIKNDGSNVQNKYFTGIPSLDEIIGGFREGQLVVLSAPTGQGKTMFLQDITRTFYSNKINCLWFSYEVAHQEFFERFGDNIPVFYLPLKIIQSKTEWLYQRILEGIAKFNTKIIFVDHLHFLVEMQLLSQATNISLLIGMLMRELKKIAIKTKTVIFLVSHLRKLQLDKLPSIDDLRDSSFVAQESDIVMIMWRNKEKGGGFLNEATLIVDKNRRTGKTGKIQLIFENGRFSQIDDREVKNSEDLPF